MRIRLVGSTELRPPVAETYGDEPEPVDPPDPGDAPDPIILTLEDGAIFHRSEYLILGYNRFDVMCVGAVGGYGSGYRWTKENGGQRQYYGGAGGGGGAQRITGRLALLPSSIPVEVGAAVTAPPVFPTWEDPTVPDWESLVAGVDGGPSAFGDICKASGGKGGSPAPEYSELGANNGGNGGDGGKGASLVAGGGGAAGMPDHGEWNPVTKIGEGGGGGRGGGVSYPTNAPFDGGDAWTYQDEVHNAQSGGHGSISDDDLFKGPLDPRDNQHFAYWVRMAGDAVDSDEADVPVIPGFGGGANVQAITGESQVYGSLNGISSGIVVIKLYHA